MPFYAGKPKCSIKPDGCSEQAAFTVIANITFPLGVTLHFLLADNLLIPDFLRKISVMANLLPSSSRLTMEQLTFPLHLLKNEQISNPLPCWIKLVVFI